MKEIVEVVPKPAIRWGLAGLIPYAGTSLAIVHFARQAKLAVENGGQYSALDVDVCLLRGGSRVVRTVVHH